MTPTFQTVYSLPRNMYSASALVALVGVLLVLFGRALWRRIEAPDIWDWLGQVCLAGGLQVMGAAIVLVLFVFPTVQGLILGVRLARGHYQTFTGTVTSFQPGDGHRAETWTLQAADGSHTYSYNPYVLTPGFTWIHSEGGPIREGLVVRVADVNGHIARLEIARERP